MHIKNEEHQQKALSVCISVGELNEPQGPQQLENAKCLDGNSSIWLPQPKFVTEIQENDFIENVLTGQTQGFGFRDQKAEFHLLVEELELNCGRFWMCFLECWCDILTLFYGC